MENKNQSVYEDFSETSRTAMSIAKKTVKDYFPFFIMIVDIVFTVLTKFYRTGFDALFSASYFIELASNIMAVMFCYSAFVPYAYDKEKQLMTEYGDTYRQWMGISRRVRHGLNAVFGRYCREKDEEDRTNIRRAFIENHTMIPWAVYLERYAHTKPGMLRAMIRTGELSAGEAKAIKRANRQIKMRATDPVHILCGARPKRNANATRDVNRNGIAIAMKPVSMILLSVIVTAFSGEYVGLESFSVIYSMIYSVILIIVASFTGYSKGASNARADLDVMKIRVLYLESFFEAKRAIIEKVERGEPIEEIQTIAPVPTPQVADFSSADKAQEASESIPD
ncbi:MAG: hypothetical protein IJW83_00140 [Clostridia bacterium]|nr:hypothetical protein [Clostridia bacterium]